MYIKEYLSRNDKRFNELSNNFYLISSANVPNDVYFELQIIRKIYFEL